jgi:transcriptional regulator with XRE-family HTH domain
MYRKYLALLDERKVTTKQVCDATKIPESTMSMWKTRWLEWEQTKNSKEPTPSLETILKLSKYFNVSVEYFTN